MVWNWHLDILCDEVQLVFDRVFAGLPKEYDLVFNVPPGTSKTSVISILSQAWAWANKPDMRFICATHTDSLVNDIATRAKDVVQSEKFREWFPHVILRHDRGSKDDYANTCGGERKSCTVGGKTPTGRHAHVALVDDPIDPQGARSEVELEQAKRFMTEVIPSRVVDKLGSPLILVMQRLAPRDPTEVMLNISKITGATPVRHICLPGELTEDVSPPLEWLREKYGDEVYAEDRLLDPQRLPRRALVDLGAKLGRYAYAGQILQKPVPPGGGMFKPQWFNRRVRCSPYNATRIRYWDRAATQDGGCYTAGVLLARDAEGNYYVEHVVHGQWDPDERNEIMVATAHRDRARYGPNNTPLIVVEAERGSTGIESFRNLARKLAGFRVKEDQPTGSKDTRAEPWADQLAAGTVLLVEDGTWDVEGYVQEHLLFRPDPTTKRLGKFKDQVDASSGAFNMLVVGSQREGPVLRVLPLGRQKHKGLRLVVSSRNALETIIVEERSLLVRLGQVETEVSHVTSSPAHVTTDRIRMQVSNGADPKATRETEVGHEEGVGPAHLRLNSAGGESTSPGHGLNKLLDTLTLSFADISPEEYQDKWDALVPCYGCPPAELIMRNEHGKKLWSFLRKQRAAGPEVVVFCDDGDRRAQSMALAVADAMRLPRGSSIFNLADGEKAVGDKDVPPNRHVYEVTKATRSLVV